MSPPSARALIDRARTELRASRKLIDDGFPDQAISHAYHATFLSAEAALLAIGETRSKHSGVISAFGELVAKPGHVDRQLGSVIRELFRMRNEAAYNGVAVSSDVARTALEDADRFLNAVDDWLQGSSTADG